MKSASDNQPFLESEWISAVMVIGVPLVIALVAIASTFFV